MLDKLTFEDCLKLLTFHLQYDTIYKTDFTGIIYSATISGKVGEVFMYHLSFSFNEFDDISYLHIHYDERDGFRFYTNRTSSMKEHSLESIFKILGR